MGKQLEMRNGDVSDAVARVCHDCQTPGDLAQYADGEWHCPECVPEVL